MGTSTPGSFKQAKYSVLTLPSGNTIRAKRVSVEEWIATGEIPNALKPVLAKALEGKRPTVGEVLGGENGKPSEERLQDLMQMYDFAATKVFVEPRCYPAPKDESERSDEKLYVDEVGPEDKAFVFYWSTGGSSDIEKFRKGSAEALGDLAASEDVAPTPVGASGDT